MPELEEFFSTKGARGGKPSAEGASKGPSASTPSNTSARSERYPTAAQLNAAPAKAPSKQANQNTGRPQKTRLARKEVVEMDAVKSSGKKQVFFPFTYCDTVHISKQHLLICGILVLYNS